MGRLLNYFRLDEGEAVLYTMMSCFALRYLEAGNSLSSTKLRILTSPPGESLNGLKTVMLRRSHRYCMNRTDVVESG